MDRTEDQSSWRYTGLCGEWLSGTGTTHWRQQRNRYGTAIGGTVGGMVERHDRMDSEESNPQRDRATIIRTDDRTDWGPVRFIGGAALFGYCTVEEELITP